MPTVTKQRATTVSKPTAADSFPNGDGFKSAWDLSEHISLLLYGDSGTGKTTLWATFPGPILALISTGLSKPGELKSINTPEYRKKINPVVIQSSDDYYRALDLAPKYSTVVLDHAGGFSDMVLSLDVLMLENLLEAKHRKAGKGESWSVVSQADYGQLAMELHKRFAALLNLQANAVIVAHERIFRGKEEAGNASDVIKPSVGAALTPSVTGWLNKNCDYILQTFKRPRLVKTKGTVAGQEMEVIERGRGVEYCLRTEPHEVFMTKFRMPRGRELPECIVDPSYDKIMKLIKG